MEAAGLAVTCHGLVVALVGLVKFSKKIRDAPKEWQRYCALLNDFCQLSRAVESLTHNMTGLNKLIIPHNQQSYDLIDFCRRSVQNALDDACGILSKFEQKGNTKLFHVSTWVQNKGKQLLYVLQEEDIQGCIQRIETSMAGLGVAIQTAALAQTHDAYNENKAALGQLTEKLSENLEKLERNHNEILNNQGNSNIRVVVAPIHRRNLRFSPRRSKRIMQPQLAQTAAAEDLGRPVGDTELPQVSVLPVLEKELDAQPYHPYEVEDLAGHVPMSNLEALAQAIRTSKTPCQSLVLIDRADDIEITCEDGSLAIIPAGKAQGFDAGGTGQQTASVSMPEHKSLIRLSQSDGAFPSDAEELLEFLVNDAPHDDLPPDTYMDSSNSVKTTSFFRFEYVPINNGNPEGDGKASERFDVSLCRFLCVEKLVFDDYRFTKLVARKACAEFPWCDHSHLEHPGGGVPTNELVDLTEGQIILHSDGEGGPLQFSRMYEVFDALVYDELCVIPCSHTRVEEKMVDGANGETDVVFHCMKPIGILALIGTFTKDEMSDEESGDEDEYVCQAGPFRSVPCLFCHKKALRPRLEESEASSSVISYGSHSYGYRCARCQKISWLTGASQPGFEGAEASNVHVPITSAFEVAKSLWARIVL